MSHIAAILGQIAATVLVQGLSHMKVNRAHYDSTGFFRDPPAVAPDILAMQVQCALLTTAHVCAIDGACLWNAPRTNWAFGAILSAYMAFGIAGEMKAPDIRRGILVEGTTGFIQFTLADAGLRAAHRFL